MSPAILALLVTLAQTPAAQAQTPAPQIGEAQGPTLAPRVLDVLRTQVMLDRAGFSPGAIDGKMGASTRKALAAFQQQVAPTAGGPAVEPLVRYLITPEDAAGPFVEHIPADLVEQGKLPHLGYRSVVEALAERFHTTPAFLKRLNPAARFAAGEEIHVPNVEPMIVPTGTKTANAAKTNAGTAGAPAAGRTPPAQEVVVTVSKSASALTVTDAATGRVVLYAPVTTGSERDPLPIGEWKVTGVGLNPPFNYNPDLFWDADAKDTKTKIPPGPNNPVGVVWIDLSKEHYGIHGTPEPSTIGRTQSHGCVRLTNWDALNVAALVRPGTKVVFTP